MNRDINIHIQIEKKKKKRMNEEINERINVWSNFPSTKKSQTGEGRKR